MTLYSRADSQKTGRSIDISLCVVCGADYTLGYSDFNNSQFLKLQEVQNKILRPV